MDKVKQPFYELNLSLNYYIAIPLYDLYFLFKVKYDFH